jgi:hypothetical protein
VFSAAVYSLEAYKDQFIQQNIKYPRIMLPQKRMDFSQALKKGYHTKQEKLIKSSMKFFLSFLCDTAFQV